MLLFGVADCIILKDIHENIDQLKMVNRKNEKHRLNFFYVFMWTKINHNQPTQSETTSSSYAKHI